MSPPSPARTLPRITEEESVLQYKADPSLTKLVCGNTKFLGRVLNVDPLKFEFEVLAVILPEAAEVLSTQMIPDTLKPGMMVAVCPHLIDGEKVLLRDSTSWQDGGTAKSEDNPQKARHFTCKTCAKVDRSEIGFRAAKFYAGQLNLGWWEFQTKGYPGRPRKTA